MQFLTDLTRSPQKAIGLALIQFVILASGMAIGSAKYDDWDFAARYLPTLAVVTVLFVAVTVLMGSSREEMGLQATQNPRNLLWVLPGVLAVVAVAIGFGLTWANLPEGASIDGGTMVKTFIATLLVGFTEEWMYRGLLVVVLTRWLGFRNGLLLSAAGFGIFHLSNVIAGQSLPLTLRQVVFTALLGLSFLLIALATRSLIPGMIAHALYDFFLLGQEQLHASGADKSPVANIPILLFMFVAVVIALRFILTAEEQEPYAS